MKFVEPNVEYWPQGEGMKGVGPNSTRHKSIVSEQRT